MLHPKFHDGKWNAHACLAFLSFNSWEPRLPGTGLLNNDRYLLDISGPWCLQNLSFTSPEFILYFHKLSSQVTSTCSFSAIIFKFSFCVAPCPYCNKSLLLLSGLFLLMTFKITSRVSRTGNMNGSNGCHRADSATVKGCLEQFQRLTSGRNGIEWGMKNQWRAVKVYQRESQDCWWWTAVMNTAWETVSPLKS